MLSIEHKRWFYNNKKNMVLLYCSWLNLCADVCLMKSSLLPIQTGSYGKTTGMTSFGGTNLRCAQAVAKHTQKKKRSIFWHHRISIHGWRIDRTVPVVYRKLQQHQIERTAHIGGTLYWWEYIWKEATRSCSLPVNSLWIHKKIIYLWLSFPVKSILDIQFNSNQINSLSFTNNIDLQ